MLAFKYHFALKGTTSPWRNGSFQDWTGKIQDKPGNFQGMLEIC